ASFENSGQKIRTPAQVIEDRLGTCLDLACTYAACLEQVGLNPVLCLIQGHAFAGVFLDGDIGFRDPSMRKLNPALNVLDAGKLVTVETVAYTSGTDIDFEQAVAAGRAHWHDAERFRAVVDIRAARRNGVLPLPARVLRDGQVTVIVEEKVVQAAPVVVTTVQPVVATPRDRAAAPPRIQQWKRSLLDLSLRNPLLNLSTKRSGLSVLVPTDSLPILEDILMGGHALKLFAHDQLTQIHRERGARGVADISADLRREWLTKERVLHVDASEDAIARRLRSLREKARLAEEEGGTNMLHLTLGSLHWTDPAKGKAVRSPILLLPVRLHAMGRGASRWSSARTPSAAPCTTSSCSRSCGRSSACRCRSSSGLRRTRVESTSCGPSMGSAPRSPGTSSICESMTTRRSPCCSSVSIGCGGTWTITGRVSSRTRSSVIWWSVPGSPSSGRSRSPTSRRSTMNRSSVRSPATAPSSRPSWPPPRALRSCSRDRRAPGSRRRLPI
ncbi:MAG: DUF4011 domain-containing protein, partial [Deltaproteobacteria bacterium]|nr:DUF4011 domain-containing protein [Deltaproteobacteria bacterium]